MVRRPCIVRRFSAALISRRRSDTVPPMADTSTKVALVCSAMTCASEVFPVPAGPKRMTELKLSPSMAPRNQLPGPTASVCPTTSSSVRGRMRTASGATSARRSFSIAVNKVSMPRIISCERLFAQRRRSGKEMARRKGRSGGPKEGIRRSGLGPPAAFERRQPQGSRRRGDLLTCCLQYNNHP